MSRPALEVADIFRRYGPRYRQTRKGALSRDQLRVMRAIEICRTAEAGGHLEQCDSCRQQLIAYNSCRNRHCPKCQSLERARWLAARQSELLPENYFHVVFTLPEAIARIGLQNKKTVYNILFRAVSETLSTIAADPRHLGVRIGFIAILHTWGQNLHFHPHLHCVVPGGGLAPDRQSWIPCRSRHFFLPVRVLSRLFRGKFLAYLQAAFDAGELNFSNSLAHLRDRHTFRICLRNTRMTPWVVYCKPPFGGPDHVLDYLGRYTHRIAISNHRLRRLQDGRVTFAWKDYRQGNRPGSITLPAEEFIRRFLLHTLPSRFVRIRQFGFLANRSRSANIELCRKLLGPTSPPLTGDQFDPLAIVKTLFQASLKTCPLCGKGHLFPINYFIPARRLTRSPPPGVVA